MARWNQLPKDIRKSIGKNIALKKKQNMGFEPPSSKLLYHGSNKKLAVLKPQAHYLTGDKPVVFATPDKGFALAFMGKKWRDSDFDLGSVGDGPTRMVEMYPGAFEKFFRGQSGYLYTLEPDGFVYKPQLMRKERVHFGKPKVKRVQHVSDVLRELERSNMTLVRMKK